jgi:PAS domain S-box-containing protein
MKKKSSVNRLKRLSDMDFLSRFAVRLAELSPREDLRKTITRVIRLFTGALFVSYSEYDPAQARLTLVHVDIPTGPMRKVIKSTGKNFVFLHSAVSKVKQSEMLRKSVIRFKSLNRATYGAVTRETESEISVMIKMDRYYGISLTIDNILVGRILIGLTPDVSDPDTGLLKAISHIATVALRRKQAEDVVREREESYKILVESQGEGIGIVDPEEVFVFSNPAAEEIFGVKPGGLTGRSLMEFVVPEHIAMLTNESAQRDMLRRSTYEIDIITSGGIRRNILVTATPQTDAQKRRTGTFGIFRDITERRKTEIKLREQADELKLLNATRDKFFAIIAHDLKSPFQAILGFSNLLLDTYREMDQETIERSLQALSGASQQAYSLLENLLLWSRAQSGKLDVMPESIDANKEIGGIIELFRMPASRKKINIGAEFNGDIRFNTDKNMFHTILRNLISNALKFTPAGGSILITAKQENGQVIMAVQDTGVGISPEKLSLLFTADRTTSTPGTNREEGNGLGLTLCREFAGRLGGYLWGVSEPGKGSTFYCSLPCQP